MKLYSQLVQRAETPARELVRLSSAASRDMRQKLEQADKRLILTLEKLIINADGKNLN